MCLNMAASHGTHCILNLAPASCLTCAFCGHHAPWSSCHGVFTLLYSPYLRAPYKIPRHSRVVSTSLPRPLLVRQKEFLSWFLLLFFFLHLTGAPQHRPSFLHGGLVSNYFLASGDFLRCVAGVRKDLCLCHGRRNLALICSSGPTPNPVPSLVVVKSCQWLFGPCPHRHGHPCPLSSEAF